jgi:hypothetical protein
VQRRPAILRARKASAAERRHARRRGGRTLLLASLSAPRSSSSVATSSLPLKATSCSGVQPSCERAERARAAQRPIAAPRALPPLSHPVSRVYVAARVQQAPQRRRVAAPGRGVQGQHCWEGAAARSVLAVRQRHRALEFAGR